MRKLICLLLCVCLACPFGLVSALAEEATAAATETVLFEENFEGYDAGEAIRAQADTYGEWSSAVASSVSTITAATDDASHGISAYYSHSGSTSGGPRLHKMFYFEQEPTNMTINYETKATECAMSLSIYFSDGTSKQLYSTGSTAWEKVRVEINFAQSTFTVYSGGVSKKTGSFSAPDYSTLEFRFSTGVAPGKYCYLDNVKFTTTDDVDAQRVSDGAVGIRTPEEIMAPFAGFPAAPALSVPNGKYTLFTYDGTLNANNGISTGSEVLWTSVRKAMPAFLEEQPLIRLTNDKLGVQYGYLLKTVAVGEKPGNVIMEYYTLLADGGAYVTLQAGNKELANTNGSMITEATAGAIIGGWNKIKAVFDFTNQLCNVYVNDTLTVENLGFTNAVPADTYEVTIGAYGKLAPASSVLVDNFIMYQDRAPVIEGVKYYGVTGTNWDLVTADIVLTEDSYVNNLRQHPRLLINDRQAIIDKINADPQVKSWYDSYKKTADTCIDPAKDTGPYAYEFTNGRNLKGVAGNIESRLKALGFAYLVEGNEAYVERGIEEIYNLGTFPDWSNSSPILSSGIMCGVACFYDWCYNAEAMTSAVKEDILQIVKNKSLWQFVRSYDGANSVEIANGVTNRTTVANACGAAMAIAMADEEPALAQKLIDGAIKHVKQTVEAYSPDGAFAEGTSYWNYANDSMFNFLAEMDNAVVEGYTKPAALQWYYEDARLQNTPDYWAYMYGFAGNFDYGDSSASFAAHPLLFWHSQRYNKPFYGWFLERTVQRIGSSVGSKEKAILYFDPEFEYYNDGSMPLDKTFNASDLAQVASMRSSWTAKNGLYAAIQGGDNSASHMSKSLGTFVLDANGKRFIKQLGHVDYAALYDSDLYYMERAEGNNTIIANPGTEIDQNPKAIARFIAHGEAENEAFTVLDMTQTNDAFADAKRGMFMTKGRNSVVLQDEITTNTPSEIWWFAHTEADITLVDGGKGAIMRIDDEKLYARITSGPEAAVFTVMEAEMLHPEIAAPDADAMQNIVGHKLAIHLSDVSTLTLAVEFIPLRDGEGLPTAFTPVKPISTWSVSDNTISAKRQAGDALVMLAGSPSVLAFEEKFVWDEKDAKVAPYEQDGILYVPAKRAAELIYAKATVSGSSVSVTRNAVTNTITEGIVTVSGTVYVPASALANALGMQLYTDESGLVAFADRAVNYTAAQKQAIYTELDTCVYIGGKLFGAFSTEKTVYYVPYADVLPSVRVSDGTKVTKTQTEASFTVNGTTYTIYRVDVNEAIAKYNAVLGTVAQTDKPGVSNPVANMTDGDMNTAGAIKDITPERETLTFELDTPHYIKEFVLTDQRPAAGSVAETVEYLGRLEDGTWVDLAGVDNLEDGTISGVKRTNTTPCTVTEPITAIQICLTNTDAYQNYIYVYEFEAIGIEKTAGMAETATYTTYTKQATETVFTTEIISPPTSGYLVTVLYQGDKSVGMKITPVTGEDSLKYSIGNTSFDTVRVMLIESFVNMRILAETETLNP